MKVWQRTLVSPQGPFFDLGLSKGVCEKGPSPSARQPQKATSADGEGLQECHFCQGRAFLKSIATMDQSWVLYDTPERKEQSKMWTPRGGNPPIKATVQSSARKRECWWPSSTQRAWCTSTMSPTRSPSSQPTTVVSSPHFFSI